MKKYQSEKQRSSIILGIDPGSRITGYGLIAQSGKTLSYVASGCIRTQGEDFCQRLTQIFDGISQLMREYQADFAAIESVFMHQNAGAALKLGQARGAAIVAMSAHAVDVGEYSPRQVKQAVVGYGGATKEQVQHMIVQLLSLSGVPQADAADALGVAVCHAHTLTGLAGMAGVKGVARSRLR